MTNDGARALLLRDASRMESRLPAGWYSETRLRKCEKVIDVRRGRGGGTPVSAAPEESSASSLKHKDARKCSVRDPEADYHVPAPDPGPPGEDKLLQSMSLTGAVSSWQSEWTKTLAFRHAYTWPFRE